MVVFSKGYYLTWYSRVCTSGELCRYMFHLDIFCSHLWRQCVDLPFKPTCVVSGLKLKAYYLYFYLRLTVGSKPFSHVFTQKEQRSSPQVSPSLQPHLVSVVAVQACRRT